jgi:hypothetical protein
VTLKECLVIGHRVGFAMDSAGRKVAWRDPETGSRVAYQRSRAARYRKPPAEDPVLPRERRKNDALYVLEASTPFDASGHLVKVGRSKNIEARLRCIAAGFPFDLKVVGVFPKMGVVEFAVHDALAKYATATERKSEWFWVPADVRRALETLDLHAVGVTAERLEAVLAGLEAAR